MGHILCFNGGYVNELIVENKNLFFAMVNSMTMQSEGCQGDWMVSVSDKPVEFSKYTDLSVQFAPFQVNRKNLLNKLYAVFEHKALLAENYIKTGELLGELERYLFELAEELPFDVRFQKLAIGPIIRALAPVIDEDEKSSLERIFSYMELIRELDRERVFIMINMRSYFSNEDMDTFIESVCLHDFKLLLLESSAQPQLKNSKRYIIDVDLCEL